MKKMIDYTNATEEFNNYKGSEKENFNLQQ